MPLVIVKMWAGRDEKVKSKLADDLFQTMQDSMGVRPEGLTIAIHDIPKEEWDETVKAADITPYQDDLYYLYGKKQH